MYRRDASFLNAEPLAFVAPGNVDQAAAVVRACRDADAPFCPRGAGTGLAGGATPVGVHRRPVVIGLSRMDAIRELDVAHRRVWVEPGVVNLRLGQVAAQHGLRFAPDPASQIASTLGGNVATNAGGIHCLSYGVTSQHVLAVELIDTEGEIHLLDGRLAEQEGLDVRGLTVGSEGTLGLITAASLRLIPAPPSTATLLAGFPSILAAAEMVSALVTGERLPDAIELMDARAVGIVEPYAGAGYPLDAAAVLLVEYEGLPAGVSAGIEEAETCAAAHGARTVSRAETSEHRARLWKGRKAVAGAIAKVKPDCYLHDVVVPRSMLAAMLGDVLEIGERNGLPVLNVLHAGDGNLHPFLLFDRREAGVLGRVMAAGHAIVSRALELGGSVTGEHGVGAEKRDFLCESFDEESLVVQRAVRTAVDPRGLANPHKVLPAPATCAELSPSMVPEGAWM